MRYQPDLQALAPWVAAFGITPQTRIETPLGSRAASDLSVGDFVTTRDDGPLFEHIRVPLMFGTDAVLVRAKSLCLSHERVNVENAAVPISYIQISLPQQGIIFAEGVAVETILPDGECDLGYMTVRAWELQAAVA